MHVLRIALPGGMGEAMMARKARKSGGMDENCQESAGSGRSLVSDPISLLCDLIGFWACMVCQPGSNEECTIPYAALCFSR